MESLCSSRLRAGQSDCLAEATEGSEAGLSRVRGRGGWQRVEDVLLKVQSGD